MDALLLSARSQLLVEFDQRMRTLRAAFADVEPMAIVAGIVAQHVLVPGPVPQAPAHFGGETRVDLACGVLATQRLHETSHRPLEHQLPAVLSRLEELFDTIYVLEYVTAATDSRPRPEMLLRAASSADWLLVRGTSYAGHGEDLAVAVFATHRDWMKTHLGFSTDRLLEVSGAIRELVRGRIAAVLDDEDGMWLALQQALTAGAPPHFVSVPDADEVLEAEVLVTLSYHPSLRDAMTFRASEIASAIGYPDDEVKAIVDAFSTELGSLGDSEYRGPYDPSPLIGRPILRSGDECLLPIPDRLTRDAVSLLDERVRPRGYHDARARAVDELAAKYLLRALPGAEAYLGLYYPGAESRVELDALVVFDDVVLIVEGKGHRLSAKARRGDVQRLRGTLEDIAEGAWIQAQHVRTYLLSGEEAIFTDRRGNERLRLAVAKVQHVFVVNPTLHHLAGHATRLRDLSDLGLFQGGEYPWSVFINDLRVIAETADNAAVFLHYLRWRAGLILGLGGKVSADDEIDLWQAYLRGQELPTADEPVRAHVFTGGPTPFDAYYDAVAGRGPASERPRKHLTRPIRAFVERMANERPTGWLPAAETCLNLSIPEQQAVVGEIETVTERANRERQQIGYTWGRMLMWGLPAGAEADEMPPPMVAALSGWRVLLCRQIDRGRAEIEWAFTLPQADRATKQRRGRVRRS